MSTVLDKPTGTGREDKPLTREDVLKFVDELGGSDNLNLSGRNLKGINLTHLDLNKATFKDATFRNALLRFINLSDSTLDGAKFSFANLTFANLSRAKLTKAILYASDLSGANLTNAILIETELTGALLTKTNLKGANLSRAKLTLADLRGADLTGASLVGANLGGANLLGANLAYADLSGANLSGANLSRATLNGTILESTDLTRTNLTRATLTETTLKHAHLDRTILFATDIPEHELNALNKNNIIVWPNLSSTAKENTDNLEEQSRILTIRIMEEPLSALNFSTVISALTELHTKCWLIKQRRFSDLIEFSQLHNISFSKEANLVISKLTHNSPAEIKLDVGIKDVAEALRMGIDGLIQSPLRYEDAKLANRAKLLDLKIREEEAKALQAVKEQALNLEEQRIELEKKERQLDLEKKQLEIDSMRLGIQVQRLDVEKKRIEYALETAGKMIDVLHPSAERETKEMLMRTMITSLLQLGNNSDLELPLSPQSTQITPIAEASE